MEMHCCIIGLLESDQFYQQSISLYTELVGNIQLIQTCSDFATDL